MPKLPVLSASVGEELLGRGTAAHIRGHALAQGPHWALVLQRRVTLGTKHPWSTDPRALCPIPGDLVCVSSQGKLNLGAALFFARENILAGLSPWLYDFIVRKWKCQGSTPGCSLGSPPCLHS